MYGNWVDTLTPGEVAAHLKVSAPTVRRMATVYEQVFEPLDRDTKRHRLWSLDALRRVQVAHAAVSTGRVTSLERALVMVRDGVDLPARVVLPVELDTLSELLVEVRSLRALVEVQGRELAALRSEFNVPKLLPTSKSIEQKPTAQPERLGERSASSQPAVIPQSREKRAGENGLFPTLLRVLGVRR